MSDEKKPNTDIVEELHLLAQVFLELAERFEQIAAMLEVPKES